MSFIAFVLLGISILQRPPDHHGITTGSLLSVTAVDIMTPVA